MNSIKIAAAAVFFSRIGYLLVKSWILIGKILDILVKLTPFKLQDNFIQPSLMVFAIKAGFTE